MNLPEPAPRQVFGFQPEAPLKEYLDEIQRIIERLQICIAGVDRVKDNEEFPLLSGPLEFRVHHTPVCSPEIRKDATLWLTGSAFCSVIDAFSRLMDQTEYVASLAKEVGPTGVHWQGSSREVHDCFSNFQDSAYQDKKSFRKSLSFERKLESLESRFVKSGGGFPWRDHLISLNKVRACIIHRDGVVSYQDDIGDDSSDVLSVSFLRVVLACRQSENGPLIEFDGDTKNLITDTIYLRQEPSALSWKADSRVAITPEDALQMIYTTVVCAKQLTRMLEDFIRNIGGGTT